MSKPKVLFDKLFQRQKGNCYICGVGMKRRYGFENSATIDHVIPKSQLRICSVDYLEGNKRLACYKCNQEKGSKPRIINPNPAERKRNE